MKKTKKPGIFEWNRNVLANALKRIDYNIILIIILDGLFYLAANFIVLFWWSRIEAKIFSMKVQNATMGDLYLMVFSFILVLISIIFLASLANCVIWARTTKTKLTMGLISRFLALNLIWLGFWLALAVVISLTVVSLNVAAAVLTFLLAAAIYLTNNLYTVFMKIQRLKAIKDALQLSYFRLRVMAIPYALIFLVLLILLKLRSISSFKFSGIIFGIFLLAYSAFLRYYASELVAEAGK